MTSSTKARESAPALSTIERVLHALGADPGFTAAVIGDMTEEYAVRRAHNGLRTARLWYVQEALRSAPHFLWNAIQYGSPRARACLAACVAGLALLVTMVTVAIVFRDGRPAQLVASAGNAADGIVVNNLHPVQLEMRVLDAAGHLLRSRGVHYQWASGAPISVSSSGAVTCTHDGDAIVRTSVAAITADVTVQCRRVHQLRASAWMDFVAGDPQRHLPFIAVGMDDRAVTQLRGVAQVVDSSVATLVGSSIRPRAVGKTSVDLSVGEQSARIMVIVHAPVQSFDALRADQRLVAVPVHLARGDTTHWTLPKGSFWLKYLPRREGDAPPTMTVDGAITCTPGTQLGPYQFPPDVYGAYCVAHAAGAGVTLAHGALGGVVVDGTLALDRSEQ